MMDSDVSKEKLHESEVWLFADLVVTLATTGGLGICRSIEVHKTLNDCGQTGSLL